MKHVKGRLTLAMIATTLLLFSIAFFAMRFYQKNYIFDQAILSIEKEYTFLQEQPEDIQEYWQEDRLFNVETLFLEDDDYYLNRQEKFLKNFYRTGEYVYDKVFNLSDDHGDYYVLITDLPADDFQEAVPYTNKESTGIPVMLYIDTSISSNMVQRLNTVFFVMLILMIVVEGIVGIYLGTKLENTQKKLENFFQNASHELKSPLMSIQGYAQGIESGVITDHKMASEIIIQKSQTMRELVDEILNVSKLDSGEYQFKKEEVMLQDIIEQSLLNFQTVIAKKHLDVQLDIEYPKDPLMTDALQMYKAINTLIDNACKFAVSKLSIRTEEEAKKVRLYIFNDATPLSDDQRLHIFDRFYTSEAGSTGIGLAMAKEIITKSGGQIILGNAPDGVLFEVRLPK